MVVDRITREVCLQTGDRFILLYGANTSDSFCSDDLLLQDIEQALHSYLKSQNYQRIAFYSGNRKLYFLDSESRDRALPRSHSSSSFQTNDEMRFASKWGRRKRFLGKKSPQITNEDLSQQVEQTNSRIAVSSSSSLRHPPRMRDRDVITLLQTFMEDTTQRSAIIFTHPEDLHRFELRRELFEAILEWSRLLPINPNLCVFIFHQDTYDQLQQFCREVGLTVLSTLLTNRQGSQNQVNICNISNPTVSEIGNLVQHFRLKYKKNVVWSDLKVLNSALMRESKPLKYWHDVFLIATEISLEQAYRNNWARKMPLPTAEELTNQLHQRIIGHQEAIVNLVKLVRGKIAAQKSPKPLVIMLAGPTGTGKTEFSKVLAESLGTCLERFDMGEYAEAHKVANLFGSPIGYEGASQGGQLPNALRRNQQRCILLFDEVEKAHTSIWRQLLAFFDEGRASDTRGTAIAPKDTICLLTTNLASDQICEDPNRAKEILQKTGFLSPEFIGRIDKVIPLDRLGPAEQTEMIFRLAKKFAQTRFSINLIIDRPALEVLVQQTYEQAQRYGGRGVNEKIADLFTDASIDLQSQGIVHAEAVLQHGKLQFIPSDREQPTLDFVDVAAGVDRRDETTLEFLLAELDAMTGLTSVKAAIREFVASEQAKQRLRQAGYETDDRITRHMLFLGNPGTGKTTVARLIGRILKAFGILREGQFVEATRDALVAEFVGQTAPKTRAKVEEALDGILFIDEAYALAAQPGGSGHDYGKEAIDTLVPMLENYRDRLVVIFAGYTREMRSFLAVNPGMQSRISRIIEFPDYTSDEMLDIFLHFCQTHKPAYICPPNVEQAVREHLHWMYETRTSNFGNGRDVRNLFEAMLGLQQIRLVREDLHGEAMITFAISDVPSH